MSYPKIYLMRHGQTEWNLEKRMQGHMDSPLTKLGREQAYNMGQILNREIPDLSHYAMFSSPLGRTMETSKWVAKACNFKPKQSDLLKEVCVGSWGGRLQKDVLAENPELLQNNKAYEYYFKSSDGESLEMVKSRVKAWLSSLTKQTVVVSHGQVGLVIRGVYKGIEDENMLHFGERQDGVYLLEGGKETFIS